MKDLENKFLDPSISTEDLCTALVRRSRRHRSDGFVGVKFEQSGSALNAKQHVCALLSTEHAADVHVVTVTPISLNDAQEEVPFYNLLVPRTCIKAITDWLKTQQHEKRELAKATSKISKVELHGRISTVDIELPISSKGFTIH